MSSERVLKLSAAYRAYAERLLDEALAQESRGEISPGEFKAFIGDAMRLTPVILNGDHSIAETLSFYMGKNTPERRAYIMDHLVIAAES